jgi:hypothetical protein
MGEVLAVRKQVVVGDLYSKRKVAYIIQEPAAE